jgi:Ca2+-transporting ATPase
LLGWPAILAPTQILWINLVTNGLPALALGIEPVHTDPMGSPPRARKAPLVTLKELSWLLGHGIFMALLGMLVFNYYAAPGGEAALVLARTMTFTVLAVGPLFHALNARSIDASLFSLGVFSHPKLLAALAASLAFQAIAVYVHALHSVFHCTALATRELAIAIGVSASVLLLGEAEKLVRRLWRRARES